MPRSAAARPAGSLRRMSARHAADRPPAACRRRAAAPSSASAKASIVPPSISAAKASSSRRRRRALAGVLDAGGRGERAPAASTRSRRGQRDVQRQAPAQGVAAQGEAPGGRRQHVGGAGGEAHRARVRRVAVAAEVERDRPIPLTAPAARRTSSQPRRVPAKPWSRTRGSATADTMTSARDCHLLLRAFADELARCGIAGACTSPGSRSTPLVLALVRDGRFPCFSHVDERSARLLRARPRQGDRAARRSLACTSGTAAAQLPARRHRGARGARPAGRPDRRPPARAARHRRRADDRPGQALRRRRSSCSSRSASTRPRPSACAGSARWPAAPCWTAARRAPGRRAPQLPAARAARPRRAAGEDDRTGGGGARTGARGSCARPARRAAPDPRAGAETLAAHRRRRAARRRRRRPRGARTARPAASPAGHAAGAFARGGRLAAAGRPAVGRPDGLARRRALRRAAARRRPSPAPHRPDVVLRVGDLPTSKPLRQWLAGLDAVQVLLDPDGAWQDPAQVVDLVARPTTRPALLAALAERAPRRPTRRGPARGRDADRRAAARDRRDARRRALRAARWPPSSARACRRTRRSSSPRRCRSATSRPSPPARDVPPRVLSNRGANGIDGTLADRLRRRRRAPRARSSLLLGDVALRPRPRRAARRPGASRVPLTIVAASTTAAAGSSTSCPVAPRPTSTSTTSPRPPASTSPRAAALFGAAPPRRRRPRRAARGRRPRARLGGHDAPPRPHRPRRERRAAPPRVGRGGREPQPAEDRQQCLELGLGLGQLGRRVGVGDDADAGVAARDAPGRAARSAARRTARRPR